MIILFFFGIADMIHADDKGEQNHLKRVILQNGEKEIELKIIFGAGAINILPAGGDTLLSSVMYFVEQEDEPEITYSILGKTGYLSLSSPGSSEKDVHEVNTNIDSFEDLKKNVWTIRVSQMLPIKMSIVIGAANSDFNFGHMKLSNLNIECGASDTKIDFPEENPIKMDLLSIKAGVSKIHGYNFLNANFREFVFNGGVGIYTFDMGNKIKKNADIELNLGGASAVVRLNKETPFVVKVSDSFLSSVRVENASKRGSFYRSNNYKENENYLNIETNIGIGNFELLVGQ
jgi:hypothetical protein